MILEIEISRNSLVFSTIKVKDSIKNLNPKIRMANNVTYAENKTSCCGISHKS